VGIELGWSIGSAVGDKLGVGVGAMQGEPTEFPVVISIKLVFPATLLKRLGRSPHSLLSLAYRKAVIAVNWPSSVGTVPEKIFD
jgi:hypothetical protein